MSSGECGEAGSLAGMKVLLRNPRRELEIPGPMSVVKLLARLELNPESVLVIQGDTLVTRDARLADSDVIEIRPVISGGAGT
jgi:sulfur carrier protein